MWQIFSANILKLILKVVPVFFLQHFLILSAVHLLILRLLYYIQPFICIIDNNHNNNHKNHNNNHNDNDNKNDNATIALKFYK